MKLRELLAKKNEDAGVPSPGIAISLSMPVAVGLGLVLACAVGWAFYLGWIVGKGENPEQRLEAVTRLIKKEDAPAETPQPAQAPALAAETENSADSATPLKAAKPEGANAYPFSRPQGEQQAAWPENAPKTAEPPKTKAQAKAARPAPPKAQPATPAKPAAKGGRYDFSYQVAAFKSLREAENLKARLQKNGIKSDVRKSGKVQLVVTNIRGTDEMAIALRGKLANLKLGKPLLLSKKPVPAKKTARGTR